MRCSGLSTRIIGALMVCLLGCGEAADGDTVRAPQEDWVSEALCAPPCAPGETCVEGGVCVCRGAVSQASGRCLPRREDVLWMPGLPGLVAHHWRQPGATFVEIVSRDPTQRAALHIVSHDCPFEIALRGEQLDWRCQRPGACVVWLEAQSDSAVSQPQPLTISCEDLPVTILAPPAVSAKEGDPLVVRMECVDPDREPVAWRLTEDDTCGGALHAAGGVALYRRDVREVDGGQACVVAARCEGAASGAAIAIPVVMEEVNAPPAVSGAQGSVGLGEEGRVGYGAYDSDVPPQPLDVALDYAPCPFPITHEPAQRQITWRCEVDRPTSCQLTVRASDGVAAGEATVRLTCQ